MISRRQLLLLSGSAIAMAAAYSRPARAAPGATISYSVNYAGDFTTLAAATAGIGSDLTASSTGNVAQAGTSTTITLASAETKDFSGHPITVGGTAYLITAYNSTTKVATISARAGYPATFGSTPGSGTAYTIADVAVTLTIGQSASGSNLWSVSAAVDFTGTTTSATDTLTISGATAWNQTLPLRFSASGATNQAVGITSSDRYVIEVAGYVTINNLGIASTNANGFGILNYGPGPCVVNNCLADWLGAGSSTFGAFVNAASTITLNNCVFEGSPGTAWATNAGGYIGNNCTFVGGYGGTSRGGSWHNCAFFGFNQTDPFGDDTYVNCASDQSHSGTTVLSESTTFVSTTTTNYDLRPNTGSGLLVIGGAPATVTDIYGITRSVSASTVGAVERAYGVPATQTVSYSIGAGGDLASPTPNGSIASLSWAAGVVTLTTSSAHGLLVGTVVPVLVNAYALESSSNGFLTPTGGYSYDVATVTGASTMTYVRASNPGASPTGALWMVHGLNFLMGGATEQGDLTFYQQGLTCPSTSAGTAQIVLDASATSACVGHPIQWKTGAIGLIVAFAGGVATIAGLAGYASTFGGTPQAGDAYTVFPVNVVFNFGAPTTGHTIYNLDVWHPNAGAVSVGPGVVTDSLHTVTLHGTVPFDPTAALGTVQDGVSAICIKEGFSGDGLNNSDHTAAIGIGIGNVVISQLQIWDAGTSEGDGCLIATASVTSPINVIGCLLRGDNSTDDHQHSPFVGQTSGPYFFAISFTNCAMNSQSYLAAMQFQDCSPNFYHCTICNTANTITTTVGDTPSGSTSVTVTDASGFQTNSEGGSDLTIVGLPSAFPIGANVSGISGSVLTITNGPTAADIPNGSTVLGMALEGVAGIGDMVAQNTAFFGMITPGASSLHSKTFTTCATDSNPSAYSGLTVVPYPEQVRLASGQFGGLIDLRPKPGNGLQIGTYLSGVTADIYGQARANPPTVGAVENVAGFPMAAAAG